MRAMVKLPALSWFVTLALATLTLALAAPTPAVAQEFDVGAGFDFSDFVIDGAPDPTLRLVRGVTYVFHVSTGGHPFAIHNGSGNTDPADRFDDGVENQGIASGDLTFTPSASAP